jgi:hypothetical protein
MYQNQARIKTFAVIDFSNTSCLAAKGQNIFGKSQDVQLFIHYNVKFLKLEFNFYLVFEF